MVINSLQSHFHAWVNIGANDTVLDWIRHGVPIPFSCQPVRYFQDNNGLSPSDVHFINEEVRALERSGAIQRCTPDQVVCVSPLKCVAKKNGSKRLLVNLRLLNQYIATPKVRYEGIDNVAEQIVPEDILFSIDLKDGFFHVPVSIEFRKYLGICWNNIYYMWCVLPQGLASSPYYFYKILRPVVQYLRENNLRINLWVDDFLLMCHKTFVTDHKDLIVHALEIWGGLLIMRKVTLMNQLSVHMLVLI